MKPSEPCPRCGGPLSLGVAHWRAYCLACGFKPYPFPAEMRRAAAQLANLDVAEARKQIKDELAGSDVMFDPLHPEMQD